MTTDDIARIDPRGPRFGAAVTAVLLATAILLGPVWGLIPLTVTLAAFAAGAFLGVGRQPWGLVYRRLVRPRLAAPSELEDPRPPRFAQAIGLVFSVLGVIGALTGIVPLFYVAAAFALLAATLNAVFDFCLGCEVWTIVQRPRHRAIAERRIPVG